MASETQALNHLLEDMGTIDAEDRSEIKVFRDHPAWGTKEKWFMHPMGLLNDLHVASFSVLDSEFATELAKIEREYPDCVFVY